MSRSKASEHGKYLRLAYFRSIDGAVTHSGMVNDGNFEGLPQEFFAQLSEKGFDSEALTYQLYSGLGTQRMFDEVASVPSASIGVLEVRTINGFNIFHSQKMMRL